MWKHFIGKFQGIIKSIDPKRLLDFNRTVQSVIIGKISIFHVK